MQLENIVKKVQLTTKNQVSEPATPEWPSSWQKKKTFFKKVIKLWLKQAQER